MTDAFCQQRSWSRYCIYRRDHDTPAFRALLTEIDAAMAAPTAHALKTDSTTTVAQVHTDGKAYVIKRYNIKGFAHGLKRAFQQSRAARNWHYAHLLQDLNMLVPQPIAMIEKRWGPFRRQAYYIYRFVEGELAADYFSDGEFDAEKQARREQLEAWQQNLFSHRITHGDMKLHNFIFNAQGIWVLDLDAMRQHHCSHAFKKAKARDIKRFEKNF